MLALATVASAQHEAEAIGGLADALERLADIAILWRAAALPLARHLAEHGDAGSDAARVEYVAWASIFQAEFCAFREAVLDAHRALYASDQESPMPSATSSASLTDRQRRMYDYIVAFQTRHGYPPTRREIQANLRLSSTSMVVADLDALESAHLIQRDGGKSRGIRVRQAAAGAADGPRTPSDAADLVALITEAASDLDELAAQATRVSPEDMAAALSARAAGLRAGLGGYSD